jgi:hypothetical protein
MPSIQLSPHFTLNELIASDTAVEEDIDNSPNLQQIIELTLLCNNTLEKIRQICGAKPIEVTSGFRCPELNAAVGGASNSAHLFGCAADIVIPDFGDPLKVCEALHAYVIDLQIDQLIYETNAAGGVWVHVGRATLDEGYGGECFSVIDGCTVYDPFPNAVAQSMA